MIIPVYNDVGGRNFLGRNRTLVQVYGVPFRILPGIYLLPPLLQSEAGVWYSFPISDTIAAIVTALFAIGLLRKLGRLKDGDDPAVLGSKI